MVSKNFFPRQLVRGTPSEGLKQPERGAIIHLPYLPSGFVPQPSVFVAKLWIHSMYIHLPMLCVCVCVYIYIYI
jgi:hypothetical protein